MTKYEFTSNSDIECIEMDDNMIDFIGFIDEIKSKEIADNQAYVMRIVLNNNSGKRVQVVAWSKFIPKLEEVAQMKYILQLEGACSKYVAANAKYNAGNVAFQLVIKEHTTITKLGVLDLSQVEDVVATFDNINSITGITCIEGYIKNAFRPLISKYQQILIGSITDGIKKLEIHIEQIPADSSSLTYMHKGSYVSIKGEFIQRSFGPVFLKVSDINCIRLILTKPKKSLDFLLDGYRSIGQ